MKLNVALSTCLAVFVTACSTGAADGPEQLVGKAAPDFKLPLLAGGDIELSKLEGENLVLLDFWATWCGPCRAVMPALLEISNEYKSKGVRYLAVNLREDPDKIRAYLKSANLDIEVPLDKTGKVAELYHVKGIPTMAIVDKKGIVREVHVGSSPNLKEELRKALDKILAE
jgi:cytochrome c biogenesis protein CcmG, thiol:disulfide interchange protein DsbE